MYDKDLRCNVMKSHTHNMILNVINDCFTKMCAIDALAIPALCRLINCAIVKRVSNFIDSPSGTT